MFIGIFGMFFMVMVSDVQGNSNPFNAEVYLPFEEITNNTVLGGTYEGTFLQGTTASVVKGIHGNALHLSNTVMAIGNKRDSCFWSPDLCTNGFTLALWVKLEKVKGLSYIFCNGGRTKYSHGVSLGLKNKLKFELRDKSKNGVVAGLSASSPSLQDNWAHIVLTFDQTLGSISMFQNSELMSSANITNYQLTNMPYDEYVFGTTNDQISNASYRSVALIDEFLFWPEVKDQKFIKDLYLWYENQENIFSVYVKNQTVGNEKMVAPVGAGNGNSMSCARQCDTMKCTSFNYDVIGDKCEMFLDATGSYEKKLIT